MTIDAQSQTTQLPLGDLVAVMATNCGSDPGPDPTWYPDDWPPTESDVTRVSRASVAGADNFLPLGPVRSSSPQSP